jgi:hypothetical protein
MTSDHRVAGSSPVGSKISPRGDRRAIYKLTSQRKIKPSPRSIHTFGKKGSSLSIGGRGRPGTDGHVSGIWMHSRGFDSLHPVKFLIISRLQHISSPKNAIFDNGVITRAATCLIFRELNSRQRSWYARQEQRLNSLNCGCLENYKNL